MKILASAYACSPCDGSERAVGWNWVVQMSRNHQVIALVGSQYRQDVTRWLDAHPNALPNVRFEFVLAPGTPWHKGYRGERIYYTLWQLRAARIARKIAREEHIDLIHHITYVTCVLPTWMHRVNAPLLLGPVAGGDRIPPCLWDALPPQAHRFELLRKAAQELARRTPNFRKTMKKAALILAATEETAALMPPEYAGKTQIFQAVGLPEDFFQPPPRRENHRPARFLMVGRFSYLKGFEIGVSAFRKALGGGAEATLTILGDSENSAEMAEYRKRIEALCGEEIEKRITFAEKVDFSRMKAFYDEYDVLINCTLRDSGCFVVMEAMARAMAVITLDTGGPRVNTAEGTAVKIPPREMTALTEDFARAILRLAENEDERRALGDAARSHAIAHFALEKRACQMERFYARAAGKEEGPCPLR